MHYQPQFFPLVHQESEIVKFKRNNVSVKQDSPVQFYIWLVRTSHVLLVTKQIAVSSLATSLVTFFNLYFSHIFTYSRT